MARWAKYDRASGNITEILNEAPKPPEPETTSIVEIDDDNLNVGDSVERFLGVARVIPGKGRDTKPGQPGQVMRDDSRQRRAEVPQR